MVLRNVTKEIHQGTPCCTCQHMRWELNSNQGNTTTTEVFQNNLLQFTLEAVSLDIMNGIKARILLTIFSTYRSIKDKLYHAVISLAAYTRGELQNISGGSVKEIGNFIL